MIPAPLDPNRQDKLLAFDRLLTVMDELRLNCPWDKKQTFASLSHLTIEEVYELTQAISDEDHEELKKEIGDVLLHLVFYCRIAEEQSLFNVSSVIDVLIDKLKFRHPHIYGDVEVESEEEVKRNWEALKKQEGNKDTLSGVPKGLPSMVKAMRIQEKARGAGFDWENPSQVWEKVEEELVEFQQECKNATFDVTKAEEELGDVFFALINYARFTGLNPETALERTNQKFMKRFAYMEKRARESGRNLSDMSLEEMDVFWEEAKKV